jgi:hypothetical protein
METELRNRNIPLHRFLTNEIITDFDIKKSLKICDDEIAQVIGKTVSGNENIQDLITTTANNRETLLTDLEILTAESVVLGG